MKGTTELTAGRLLLRRYRTEDAPLLYRYFGSEQEMYKYTGWNPYATPEMAERTVRDFIGMYDEPFTYGWAIILEEEFVGTVGAYGYEAETGTIEVGLSVRKDRWGKGIATQALKAVLVYLTESEGISCVRAWCAAENTGSKKAMEKAGMRLFSMEPGALQVEDRFYDRLVYEYRLPVDLTFRTGCGTFNYRVGAVIVHDGKLLLMKNDEEPYYYTVGGRVRFNETTEEAVLREVKEEIGITLEIDRFLFFQEQFFVGEVTGTHIHELGVYYLMKDSQALEHLTCHSVTARGVAEELCWIPLEETGAYYIVPESVAARLRSLPEHPEHIIEIDER